MKVLLSDYDGTLYFRGQPYSKENIKAIEKFQKAGGKFVINTGRGYRQIEQFYDWIPHPLTFDLVIADSGASLKNAKGELIEEHPIPFETIEEVVKEFHDIPITFTVDGFFHATEQTDPLNRYHLSFRFPDVKALENRHVGTIALHFPDTQSALEAEKKIREKNWPIETNVNVNSIDCNYKGCSKALGVEKAAGYFGADHKEIYAIGDSYNDLPALLAANKAFLIQTEDPELARICKEHQIDQVESLAKAIELILNESEKTENSK